MGGINYIELSKELSYILRHNPQKIGLAIDNEGWVDIIELVSCLRTKSQFSCLTIDDVVEMIKFSEKKRHEIVNGRIRALYGHSLEQKIAMCPLHPPISLYHGTSRDSLDSIMREGLISQQRQYVHLSSKSSTAIAVGKRRDSKPVVLTINAYQAHEEGVLFYLANEDIWLADKVPAKYISIAK